MYSKMMRFLITIFFTCACVFSQAQVNYVRNAGFEKYKQCPNGYDNISLADYWNGIDTNWIVGDPDPIPYCLGEYCNVCNKGFNGVPVGSKHYQFCHSGEGMAEVRMFVYGKTSSQIDIRDYLQGKLSNQLATGKSYCITFYVNLSNGSGWAIDHIGAFLDDGTIDTNGTYHCAEPQTKANPQVVSTSIISDTLGWTKIQGNFVANGTERFITIGNFADTDHTNRMPINTNMEEVAFYLIDDVSVIESGAKADAGHDGLVSPGSDSAYIGTHEEGMPCTWYIMGGDEPIGYSGGFKVHPDTTTSYVVKMDLCGSVTYDTVKVTVAPLGSAQPSPKERELYVYPNPAGNVLTIEGAEGTGVSICNVVGQSLYKLKATKNKERVDVSALAPDVYLLQVVDGSTGLTVTRRFVKE